MNLLAFAASNSRQSINRALVDHALQRLVDEFIADLRVTLLDLNDFEMPIYSIDRETADGIPTPARDFFAKIGSSDAVLASFAEHNGTITAAWKNLFDWMSRIDAKVWQGKPLVVLAATPGPRAGAGVLQYALLASHFGGEVKGSHGVGQWSEAFDNQRRELTKPDDISALSEVLAALAS
ncbi:MAG: NAD(P)H-dependent oxidoreductase [Pseudomonadota bacterium]